MTKTSGNAALFKRQQNIERNNAVLRALNLPETVADFHTNLFKRSKASRRTATRKLKSSEPVRRRRTARAVASTGSLAEDSFFPRNVLDDIALKGRRVPRESMPAKQKTVIEWDEGFLFECEAIKENAEAWYRKISRNSELKGQEKRAMKLAYRLSQEDVTFESVRAKNITKEELMAAAFGSSPQKIGPKSLMLRVFKEVEDGDENINIRARKVQSEAESITNKKFGDYIKKVEKRNIDSAFHGIGHYRSSDEKHDKEVEDILQSVWDSAKDAAGAEEYAKKGDRQQRNCKFNKVLTRKFARLAEKKGNTIQVVKRRRVVRAAAAAPTADSNAASVNEDNDDSSNSGDSDEEE